MKYWLSKVNRWHRLDIQILFVSRIYVRFWEKQIMGMFDLPISEGRFQDSPDSLF